MHNCEEVLNVQESQVSGDTPICHHRPVSQLCDTPLYARRQASMPAMYTHKRRAEKVRGSLGVQRRRDNHDVRTLEREEAFEVVYFQSFADILSPEPGAETHLETPQFTHPFTIRVEYSRYDYQSVPQLSPLRLIPTHFPCRLFIWWHLSAASIDGGIRR